MGKEEWRPIPNFCSYEISNYGRVKSKSKVIKRKGINGNCLRKERILKGRDNGRGYIKVTLRENGHKNNFYIHRLVAKAFIPNLDNKPFVNHKDNNPNNNCVNNLEWCTHQENVAWMVKQRRNERTAKWLDNLHKSQEKTYKPVIGINIQTGEQIYFKRLNDVKKMGFRAGDVCRCCKGLRRTHKGYKWEYAIKED